MPASHRDVLLAGPGVHLTLTRHPHGCLMIFPRLQWEKFRESIVGLPMEALWWKRLFLGSALDVDMDSTGRVLIPTDLRQVAGLTREVLLVGLGPHFELWDKQTYQDKLAQETQDQMPETLKKYVF